MRKSEFKRFIDKTLDRAFEGIPFVLGAAAISLLIFVIVLFIIAAPFVVCGIVVFWVLCYTVGFIREKISQGFFDPDLGWYARNMEDKIKRWKTKISVKLKSVTTLYLKPLRNTWSLTQEYLKNLKKRD